MGEYYLAVDIGASSGRHMLGSLENGKMNLKEIHRFENKMVNQNGHLCWDVHYLFDEIIHGLKKCKDLGKIPKLMGVDTWAVDYALLDKDGTLLGNTYGYRDNRTNGIDSKVYEKISLEDLYGRTGIQKQIFNTIYQLMALKEQEPELMEQAEDLLLLPDYFNYLLTGSKRTEYTNATTTQLVNAVTKEWDWELIRLLGFKESIFGTISMPGTEVGVFCDSVVKELGFSCKVILPASHDTASAVMAVPSAEEDLLYISSGTWSLMGTELLEAKTSVDSRSANLTNEGGYDYRFRYLKNIMGLWMIQSMKRELQEEITFAQLCLLASESSIESIVDCNDERFLAPESMKEAVISYCQEHHLRVPTTTGEIAAVIYNSLARCYQNTASEIERLTQKTYDRIHIVGGGSNADYLNRLTAKYTQKEVYAGPGEATAIGNLAAQMIADECFKNLKDARNCILESFQINVYQVEQPGGK